MKDPKATCSGARRVCGPKGDCSLSICTKYGLEECQCTSEAEYCDICCKNPGKDECLAAKKINEVYIASNFYLYFVHRMIT